MYWIPSPWTAHSWATIIYTFSSIRLVGDIASENLSLPDGLMWSVPIETGRGHITHGCVHFTH